MKGIRRARETSPRILQRKRQGLNSDVMRVRMDRIGLGDGLGMGLEGQKDQRKMLSLKLVDLGR